MRLNYSNSQSDNDIRDESISFLSPILFLFMFSLFGGILFVLTSGYSTVDAYEDSLENVYEKGSVEQGVEKVDKRSEVLGEVKGLIGGSEDPCRASPCGADECPVDKGILGTIGARSSNGIVYKNGSTSGSQQNNSSNNNYVRGIFSSKGKEKTKYTPTKISYPVQVSSGGNMAEIFPNGRAGDAGVNGNLIPFFWTTDKVPDDSSSEGGKVIATLGLDANGDSLAMLTDLNPPIFNKDPAKCDSDQKLCGIYRQIVNGYAGEGGCLTQVDLKNGTHQASDSGPYLNSIVMQVEGVQRKFSAQYKGLPAVGIGDPNPDAGNKRAELGIQNITPPAYVKDLDQTRETKGIEKKDIQSIRINADNFIADIGEVPCRDCTGLIGWLKCAAADITDWFMTVESESAAHESEYWRKCKSGDGPCEEDEQIITLNTACTTGCNNSNLLGMDSVLDRLRTESRNPYQINRDDLIDDNYEISKENPFNPTVKDKAVVTSAAVSAKQTLNFGGEDLIGAEAVHMDSNSQLAKIDYYTMWNNPAQNCRYDPTKGEKVCIQELTEEAFIKYWSKMGDICSN